MLLIENGILYTPTRVIPDGALLADGQRILAVGKRDELEIPPQVERLDARGGIIGPGFVDMHVHGIGGYGCTDGDPAGLEAMCLLFARHGVTSWVPSLASATVPTMLGGLAAVRQAMGAKPAGADILGAHLEGPYINAAEKGAMPPDLLRVPTPDDYAGFLQQADIVRICTLAPELPGALEFIKALKERGVLVSAGHSNAIDEELNRAVDAGLSHSCHMFCNMGTLRRVNIRRVAGLVESILLDDRVTTEIISDGFHIAPSLMSLAYKVKGPERLAIITDGSTLTGLRPGKYYLGTREIIKEERITYLADRSAFAGSVSTMDVCLRGALAGIDLSLCDALRMASLTPATLVGAARRKGSLEPGKDADVVILDHRLRVVYTVARGQVFDASKPTGLEKQIEPGSSFTL
jgi:N-acetylglucosamine-6-phosphate deacetylase